MFHDLFKRERLHVLRFIVACVLLFLWGHHPAALDVAWSNWMLKLNDRPMGFWIRCNLGLEAIPGVAAHYMRTEQGVGKEYILTSSYPVMYRI